MSRYTVYLCREKAVEQIVPRHHIAPLAICEQIKEVSEDEIKSLLGVVVDKVTDRDTIKKIVGRDVGEGHYLRIVKS